jgi:hypothetical protein
MVAQQSVAGGAAAQAEAGFEHKSGREDVCEVNSAEFAIVPLGCAELCQVTVSCGVICPGEALPISHGDVVVLFEMMVRARYEAVVVVVAVGGGDVIIAELKSGHLCC